MRQKNILFKTNKQTSTVITRVFRKTLLTADSNLLPKKQFTLSTNANTFMGYLSSFFISSTRPANTSNNLGDLVTLSHKHSLEFRDFTLFEKSLKKVFLSTRIDKHRSIFNKLKKELLSSRPEPNIIGYKCIIKGKLSSGGNSRKKKVSFNIPLIYPSTHL